MSYKTITHVERESAYVAGREAFGERKGRGSNPHAASNLILAVLWWHGWDTAEEESQGETVTLHLHKERAYTGKRQVSETVRLPVSKLRQN
jgi:hypothetical protein